MDLIDSDVQLWVVRKDNGKMVKIRRGPAAVIGDERRRVPLLGIQLLVDCRMGRRGK